MEQSQVRKIDVNFVEAFPWVWRVVWRLLLPVAGPVWSARW